MESPEDLKAVAKALAELLRRYELHITEKGYGSHMDRHAKDHKDVGGCLDRIPTGVGGSAPTGASYVTMAAEAGLTSERRVAAGTGIAITDAGANSTVTVAVDVGIADDKILQVDDATAADNDYAKFTAAGLEGRTYAEVKQDLDLEDADIKALAVTGVEAEATLDLTGDVTVAANKTLAVDHIIEKTGAHGVNIDSTPVRLHQTVIVGTEGVHGGYLQVLGRGPGENYGGILDIDLPDDHDAAFEAFTIGAYEDYLYVMGGTGDFELKLLANGTFQVTTGPLQVNHINEYTAAHGVDIDGVLCKDDAVETDAIRGLRETSGPTSLTVGTITDGEFLKRVGATIVSAAAAGGGGVSDAAFSF